MGRENHRGKHKKVVSSFGGTAEFPERLRKEGCIYIDGLVTHSCRGKHKVDLENGMKAITTASKMDHRKVSILIGDKVLVEIPALSLSPNGNINGRLVWRYRKLS